MARVTRRYRDIPVRYSSDYGKELILVQRTYADEDGIYTTPITGSFLARTVSIDGKPPKSKPFEPRKAEACFINPDNKQGFTNRTVLIPYAPTNGQLTVHLSEILNYSGVEAANYIGESHNTNLGKLL